MKPITQIILVQTTKTDRDNGTKTHMWRVAKLIGGISVFVNRGEYHVGDFIDKNIAESLARCPVYKVTVTEKADKD